MEQNKVLAAAREMYNNHNRKVIRYTSNEVSNMIMQMIVEKNNVLKMVQDGEFRYSEYQELERGLNLYISYLEKMKDTIITDEKIMNDPKLMQNPDRDSNGKIFVVLLSLIVIILVVIVPLISIITGSGAGLWSILFALFFFPAIIMAGSNS